MEIKCNDYEVLTTIGIVFIVLKLCSVLDWSWVWVLSPFWIPAAIILILVFLCLLVLTIGFAIKYIKYKI